MRDNSVTVSKGIAIILVVMIHARCPELLLSWLCMIVMPTFFFMSGYCFKDKYLNDAKGFVVKRVTGIYWPYLKWSLLFLLLHNVFYHLNIYSDEYGFNGRTSVLFTATDFINKAISITTKMQGHEQLLGGYWFMKLLFVGSFIFYLTVKVLRSRWWGALVLLAAAIVLSYFNWRLPYFGIGTREFFAASILYIGYLYKQYHLTWHRILVINFIAFLLMIVGARFWYTTMHDYQYWIVLPYTISAVMLVLTLLHFSECMLKIKNNYVVRFLIFTGDHTMEVLTWHFLSLKLVSLPLIAIYGLPIKRLSEFPVIEEYAHQGWWIMYLFIGVGIPILGTYCYHRLKDTIFCKNQ